MEECHTSRREASERALLHSERIPASHCVVVMPTRAESVAPTRQSSRLEKKNKKRTPAAAKKERRMHTRPKQQRRAASLGVKKGCYTYDPHTDQRLGRLVLLPDPEASASCPNSAHWIHGVTTEAELNAEGKPSGVYFVCFVGWSIQNLKRRVERWTQSEVESTAPVNTVYTTLFIYIEIMGMSVSVDI